LVAELIEDVNVRSDSAEQVVFVLNHLCTKHVARLFYALTEKKTSSTGKFYRQVEQAGNGVHVALWFIFGAAKSIRGEQLACGGYCSSNDAVVRTCPSVLHTTTDSIWK